MKQFCLLQAHTIKHCPYNPEVLRKQTELTKIWAQYRDGPGKTTKHGGFLSQSSYLTLYYKMV